MMEGSRGRILAALLASETPSGLPLGEIARRVGVAHPTALAHLRRLEAEGWVEALEPAMDPDRPRGRNGWRRRYRAATMVRFQWMEPGFRFIDDWSTRTPVDWRFPLVTRVKDEEAQGFLLEFLDRAQARGLLPAYRSRFEPVESPPPVAWLIVYGSCARGDATAKSDLDLLLCTEGAWEGGQPLIDLGYEVALEHPRPLDAQMVIGVDGLPRTFIDRLRTEAVTFWCNDPLAPPFEAPARWQDGL